MNFTESVVEEAALSWLGELDYAPKHGPKIAPGKPATLTAGKLHAERVGFSEALLPQRLRDALLSGAVRVQSPHPASPTGRGEASGKMEAKKLAESNEVV